MADDFTKLRIWQEAKDLAVAVYRITARFPGSEMHNLVSQLRRASTSVAANIAEASGRYHWKDRIQFLRVARGSITETRSHLFISDELGYLHKEDGQVMQARYQNLTITLNNFIKTQKSDPPDAPNSLNSLINFFLSINVSILR